MFSSSLGTALVGAVLATSVVAYPPAYAPEKYADRIDAHTGISADLHNGVSARTLQNLICSHDIGCSKQNEVLLDTGVNSSLDVFGILDQGLGKDIGISFGSATGVQIKCVDCRTWGSAVVTNTVAQISDSIIDEVVEFLEHPFETILEAASLECLISLEDVGGHIELDVFAAEAATYTLNIFEAGLVADVPLLDTVSVGLNMFLDLVISVDAQVDLSAGFEFSFPEGASLTVDLLAGAIKNHDFAGSIMNDLPIVVLAGEAKFQAAIRVRIEAGTTVSLLGMGYSFELGVYADMLQYIAEIGSTADCSLFISAECNVNVGAYATAVANLDFASFKVAPTAVITLNVATLAPICAVRPTTTIALGAAITGSASIGGGASGSGSGSNSGSISTNSNKASITGSQPSSSRYYSNGTIPNASSTGSLPSTVTDGASLTTSTVYATQVTTITSCAANVLHCPATLASTTVVTQTVVDYTTVCPVSEAGQTATGSASSLPSLSAKVTTKVQPSAIPFTVTLTPVATTSTSTFDIPTSSVISVTPVGPGFQTTNLASISSALSTELLGSSPSSLPVGSGSLTASAPAQSSAGELSGVSVLPSGSSPSASGSGKGASPSVSGSGSFPSGSVGSGSFPSGSVGSGSFPSGSVGTGSIPSASASGSGSFPSGTAAASLPCVSSGPLLSGQTACPVSVSTPAQTSAGGLSGLSTLPAGSSPPGSVGSASSPSASGSSVSSTNASGSSATGSLPAVSSNGASPSKSIGTGSFPSASGSNGSFPSGSVGTGSFPSASASGNGSFPSASASGNGLFPSGSANVPIPSGTSDLSGISVTGGSSPSSSSAVTSSETVYTTVIVDSYTTVCPVIMTQTNEGVTSLLTSSTTSTVYSTSTLVGTSTITMNPSGSSPSGSAQITGPAISSPSASSSETVYTTVIVDSYTTVCPVTLTQTNGGTTTVLTTSSISTVYSTSTLVATSTVQVPGPAISSPAASTSETVYTTVIVDSYTTVCPVTLTQTNGGTTSVLTSSSISTVFSTSTAIGTRTTTILPSATSDLSGISVTSSGIPQTTGSVVSPAAQSSETVVTTVIVDSYTTVCPVTLTHTIQGTTSFETTTSLSTIYSTSTLLSTSTITSIPVAPTPAVSQGLSTEQIYSTVSVESFVTVSSLTLTKTSQGVTSLETTTRYSTISLSSTHYITKTVAIPSQGTSSPIASGSIIVPQGSAPASGPSSSPSSASQDSGVTGSSPAASVVSTQSVPAASAPASSTQPGSGSGNSGSQSPSLVASLSATTIVSSYSTIPTASGEQIYSTVTVIPLASTGSQPASSAQGLTTPAPAAGSSTPLSSGAVPSGSVGSSECTQPSIITISASPSLITVTQPASIITVTETAGLGLPSSAPGYPGSPEGSVSSTSGIPGQAVSVSSAQGSSIGSSTVIIPGSGASSTIIVPGSGVSSTIIVPGSGASSTNIIPGSGASSTNIIPGSGVSSTIIVPGSGASSTNTIPGSGASSTIIVPGVGSSSTIVIPNSIVPTASPVYSAGSSNSTSGYYAAGTGSSKPSQQTSVPGITNTTPAGGSQTATPSIIITGSASRSSISLGFIAVVMGAIALL